MLALALFVVNATLAVAPPNAAFHFRPEAGVLGDTIPYYWNGVYHVFYLKGANWGHISSTDLIHWRQLPDAIEKGAESAAPDGENCWTGSIVEDGGTFHLFYTGKNSQDPKGEQKVMHATSKDLIAWRKRPDDTFYADGTIYWNKTINGAIDDKQIYHHQAFRDPEVFRNARDAKWSLLLHAMLADGSSPAFARYTSDDLAHWKPSAPLLVFPKSLSGDCPHLFEANGKWYLTAADRHYTVSASPEGPFSTDMQPYDCGELFVPKTMFDGKQRILVGWIADREGHKDSGKGVWGGVMCMPRDLYPDAQGRLCQRPARQVLEAFKQVDSRTPNTLKAGQLVETPPDYMLHCRLHAETPNTEAVIVLRLAPDAPDAGYRIKVAFDRKSVTVGDRYRTYERVCDFDPNIPVELRVFVMDSVIECFINDAHCFTFRALDRADGALRIDAATGSLAIRDFEVRTLPKSPDS